MNYLELLKEQDAKMSKKQSAEHTEEVRRKRSLSMILGVIAMALETFPNVRDCGWFNQTCPSVGYRWSVQGKYGSVVVEASAVNPLVATVFRTPNDGECHYSFELLTDVTTANEFSVESFKKYVLALLTLCFKSDIDLVTNGK